MSRKDTYNYLVKSALIREGWRIYHRKIWVVTPPLVRGTDN